MSFNVFIAKINRLEDCILTKLNEIVKSPSGLEASMSTQLNDIVTFTSGLEARMSTQLNDIITSTSGLEARMITKLDEVVDQSIKRFERLITIKYNQGIESVKLTNRREFEKIEASIQTIQWGLQNVLGTSFELYNLTWLQKLLSINHPHINLEMSKHFVDVNNIVVCLCIHFVLCTNAHQHKIKFTIYTVFFMFSYSIVHCRIIWAK